MYNVGDKKHVYLCSLLPSKMETCALNVEYQEYEEVTFSVEEPHSIHLSGYYFGENQDSEGEDEIKHLPPSNVEYEEYEEVTFSVEGPHNIHLSGYYFGEKQDSEGEDDESYDSFVKRKVIEMRKRKRVDEFEKMQRDRAEFEEMQRKKAEFEETQCTDSIKT